MAVGGGWQRGAVVRTGGALRAATGDRAVRGGFLWRHTARGLGGRPKRGGGVWGPVPTPAPASL